MQEELRKWCVKVEELRPEMDRLAQSLHGEGVSVRPTQEPLVGELPYWATFHFGRTTATIRFILLDHQTDSDVVITNVTVLPREGRRNGYGTLAVQVLLHWAAVNDLHEVRATQVGTGENESFWIANGFEQCPKPNPCNDFIYRIDHESK